MRQAKEETSSPLLERSDEMKTMREYYCAQIFPIWPPGGGQNFLSPMLTILPFNVGIFLLVDIAGIGNVDTSVLLPQPAFG